MPIKSKKAMSCAVLAGLFVYVWWFSANALWLGDDINYQFVFTTDGNYSDKMVETIDDVIESQIAHYIVANSRYVAYSITQFLFIFMNHALFGLFNGIVYVIFVCLVVTLGVKLRNSGNENNPLNHPIAIAYVSIMSILCVSSKFVPTTSIGFTWTYIIALLFVFIFFYKHPKSLLGVILLTLFAFVAGAAHDTISFGFAFGFAWYLLRNIKRLPISDWIIIFLFGLGAISLLLSPGAMARVESESASLITQLLSLNYLRSFAVMILLIISAKCAGYNIKDFLLKHDFWIISIIGLFVFNFAIGGISSNRQIFGIETLSLILSVAIWPMVTAHKSKLIVGFSILFIVLGCKVYTNANTVYSSTIKYKEIKEKFQESPDGQIEIEFASGHNSMRRVLGYIVGGVQDGLYGEDEGSRYWQTLHMSRLFNHELGTHKTLSYTVPMARDIYELPDSTQVIETMPGNYYAIISKANPPKRVVAHRSALWGLKSWPSFDIYPTDAKPDFETPTLEAFSAFDQMYFVGIDSVEVIR